MIQSCSLGKYITAARGVVPAHVMLGGHVQIQGLEMHVHPELIPQLVHTVAGRRVHRAQVVQHHNTANDGVHRSATFLVDLHQRLGIYGPPISHRITPLA